jgi:signal transduction histidine kinase
VSDRDYVRVWLENSPDEPYISQPLRTRVIGDWWYFAISRPVRAADGSLIGVFASMVEIGYLERLFQQAMDRPGEAVALVNEAGRVLAAAGGGLEPGQQLSDAVMAAVRTGASGDRPITRLAASGDPMIVVGEPMPAYGLYALTAVPQPAVTSVMAWPVVLWGVLWAATTALIWLNARHRNRQDAAQRIIERHARELELTARDLDAARRRAETARSEADAANKAKSRFLAVMSHELRTPLNAILGFSELIRDRPFGDDAMSRYAEYAADINASGQHLLDLIGDILDLAKIDSGRLEINPEPNDLRALLGEAETVIRPRCASRGIHLDVAVAPPLSGIVADRRALKQTVLNLLDNAVKATRIAGTIGVTARLRDDGDVEIAIADTGIGIPQSRLDDLFRPFEQADNRYSKSGSGVGLGLVLVKRLTELHGGRLHIDSAPGKGTTVSVILPGDRAIPHETLEDASVAAPITAAHRPASAAA